MVFGFFSLVCFSPFFKGFAIRSSSNVDKLSAVEISARLLHVQLLTHLTDRLTGGIPKLSQEPFGFCALEEVVGMIIKYYEDRK